MRKMESARMARPLAGSCRPTDFCISTLPSRASTITAPGMRPAATSFCTTASMRCSRPSSSSALRCPPTAAQPASSNAASSSETRFMTPSSRDMVAGNSSAARYHGQMNLGRDNHPEIRDAVRDLCAKFDSAYWQDIDEKRAYPEAFVAALTKAGWMSALIPDEYGGSGLSLTEATVIMEEVTRSGGNAGCCHGQMYNMNTLLRHGSAAQEKKYLPKIAAGELRLQSMGVTEPGAGTDTTKIKTVAKKKGDRYVVNGQKVWTSRLQHSELMILLARTSPLAEGRKKSEGVSIFLVETKSKGLDIKPI